MDTTYASCHEICAREQKTDSDFSVGMQRKWAGLGEVWRGWKIWKNKQIECLLIPNMICKNCLHTALALVLACKRERERERDQSENKAR